MKNRKGEELGKEDGNLEHFNHMFAFLLCAGFLKW